MNKPYKPYTRQGTITENVVSFMIALPGILLRYQLSQNILRVSLGGGVKQSINNMTDNKIMDFKALLTIVCVIICFNISTCSSQQQDYCRICTDHTMCKFQSRDPGPMCTDYQPLPLTAKEKVSILHDHNFYRSIVASGNETRGSPGPQPSASNMAELTWDTELEEVAQRWADQCMIDDHDACRDVARFHVGQNMLAGGDTGPVFNSDVPDLVQKWYDEVDIFDSSVVQRYHMPPRNGPDWGHYTQIVWANTLNVGCARAMFLSNSDNPPMRMEFLVCNYGPGGNFQKRPVYQTGRPASNCKLGPSAKYPFLCASTLENTSPNKPFKYQTQQNTLKTNVQNDGSFTGMSSFITQIDSLNGVLSNINTHPFPNNYFHQQQITFPQGHGYFEKPRNPFEYMQNVNTSYGPNFINKVFENVRNSQPFRKFSPLIGVANSIDESFRKNVMNGGNTYYQQTNKLDQPGPKWNIPNFNWNRQNYGWNNRYRNFYPQNIGWNNRYRNFYPQNIGWNENLYSNYQNGMTGNRWNQQHIDWSQPDKLSNLNQGFPMQNNNNFRFPILSQTKYLSNNMFHQSGQPQRSNNMVMNQYGLYQTPYFRNFPINLNTKLNCSQKMMLSKSGINCESLYTKLEKERSYTVSLNNNQSLMKNVNDKTDNLLTENLVSAQNLSQTNINKTLYEIRQICDKFVINNATDLKGTNGKTFIINFTEVNNPTKSNDKNLSKISSKFSLASDANKTLVSSFTKLDDNAKQVGNITGIFDDNIHSKLEKNMPNIIKHKFIGITNDNTSTEIDDNGLKDAQDLFNSSEISVNTDLSTAGDIEDNTTYLIRYSDYSHVGNIEELNNNTGQDVATNMMYALNNIDDRGQSERITNDCNQSSISNMNQTDENGETINNAFMPNTTERYKTKNKSNTLGINHGLLCGSSNIRNPRAILTNNFSNLIRSNDNDGVINNSSNFDTNNKFKYYRNNRSFEVSKESKEDDNKVGSSLIKETQIQRSKALYNILIVYKDSTEMYNNFKHVIKGTNRLSNILSSQYNGEYDKDMKIVPTEKTQIEIVNNINETSLQRDPWKTNINFENITNKVKEYTNKLLQLHDQHREHSIKTHSKKDNFDGDSNKAKVNSDQYLTLKNWPNDSITGSHNTVNVKGHNNTDLGRVPVSPNNWKDIPTDENTPSILEKDINLKNKLTETIQAYLTNGNISNILYIVDLMDRYINNTQIKMPRLVDIPPDSVELATLNSPPSLNKLHQPSLTTTDEGNPHIKQTFSDFLLAKQHWQSDYIDHTLSRHSLANLYKNISKQTKDVRHLKQLTLKFRKPKLSKNAFTKESTYMKSKSGDDDDDYENDEVIIPVPPLSKLSQMIKMIAFR